MIKFTFNKVVNIVVKILIGITVFYVIRNMLYEREYWSGVYYPQGDSYGNAIYSPKFDYKEECIGWAINERGLRPEDKDVPLQDLWECNKNCQLSLEYTALINADQKYKLELLKDNKGPTYLCDDGGFDGGDWLRGDF